MNVDGKNSGFWKFNIPLLSKESFTKFKKCYEKTKRQTNSKEFDNKHVKWELFKYRIQRFAI